jgi:hypothetical protein
MFYSRMLYTGLLRITVGMERWWNDTDGKTEVLGKKKLVPMPLCPPQITSRPSWDFLPCD